MPLRRRMGSLVWTTILATASLGLGAARATETPPAPFASSTIHWPGSPVATAPAAGAGAVLAQSRIDAGPLQGPLSAPNAGTPGPRCGCPVHRVVHHHRVVHRAAPVQVAAVPPVPVYAYPPPLFYRPIVPVYGVRPFFRPRFYRPYFYGPYGYRRGFY